MLNLRDSICSRYDRDTPESKSTAEVIMGGRSSVSLMFRSLYFVSVVALPLRAHLSASDVKYLHLFISAEHFQDTTVFASRTKPPTRKARHDWIMRAVVCDLMKHLKTMSMIMKV